MPRDEVLVAERGLWAPRVVRRAGQILWTMPVESGFMTRNIELSLEDSHVAVLTVDACRYWLLHAALHHPYQLAATEPDAHALTSLLNTVLLASESEVEVLLTALDHGRAHGAISNLVHLQTGADHAAMRRGRWFSALEDVDC